MCLQQYFFMLVTNKIVFSLVLKKSNNIQPKVTICSYSNLILRLIKKCIVCPQTIWKVCESCKSVVVDNLMTLFSYWHLPVLSDACLLEELKVVVIFCPVCPTREHQGGKYYRVWQRAEAYTKHSQLMRLRFFKSPQPIYPLSVFVIFYKVKQRCIQIKTVNVAHSQSILNQHDWGVCGQFSRSCGEECGGMSVCFHS